MFKHVLLMCNSEGIALAYVSCHVEIITLDCHARRRCDQTCSIFSPTAERSTGGCGGNFILAAFFNWRVDYSNSILIPASRTSL